MTAYFWVGLGSALGGMSRYWLSGIIAEHFGEAFPVGTLVVNASGSFLIGLLAALSDTESRAFISASGRQFLMVGLLGGYTTFSSFSLQTLNLVREGDWLYTAWNVTLSVGLCLGTVWLGHVSGQFLNSKL